jgi:hypothetical protein
VNAPADINIIFDNAEPGKSLLMCVQIETGKPMVFEAISPPVLAPAQLAEYVGDYYIANLNEMWMWRECRVRTACGSGRLWLRRSTARYRRRF